MTLLLLPNDPRSGAEFSEDRVYRYKLWRHWGPESEPSKVACFCMLNPSTANENDLDPTLRRCVAFAKSWSCTGMVVVNLFAVVSADPTILLTQEDAIGDTPRNTTLGRIVTNTNIILQEVEQSHVLMLGWGAFPEAVGRAKQVFEMLEKYGAAPQCLGTTQSGAPKHPLYVASWTPLMPYEMPACKGNEHG